MAEHALDQDKDQGLLARWKQTQPVRLWLYGIAVPLLAALVGYALLTEHHMALWLAVVQAVLLGGGVEGARQFAVAPATARTAVSAAVWETTGGDEDAARAATRLVSIRYRIPS